jgi:dihydrolipoamide dehydrogenase
LASPEPSRSSPRSGCSGRRDGDGDDDGDGEEIEVSGDRLLLATGRRPNADTLNVSAAGIRTTEAGFVETDECLGTSVDGVYAIGDIGGNHRFKHVGDKEAEYVLANAVGGAETPVAYPGMAHAVFGSPQVASPGATADELDDGDDETGTFEYDETALGSALHRGGGFGKVLVGDDGEVLGCHVVGPEASTLIHEVSTAVAAGADDPTPPPNAAGRVDLCRRRTETGAWTSPATSTTRAG